jgi:hypothetical protein
LLAGERDKVGGAWINGGFSQTEAVVCVINGKIRLDRVSLIFGREGLAVHSVLDGAHL